MQIRFLGAQNFHRAAADLEKAGGRVRNEFIVALKQASGPTLRKVQRAARTMRIVGFRTGHPPRFRGHLPGGHIRARVARAVEVKLITGGKDPTARFSVNQAGLGNAKNVPFHLDSAKIFRHPLPNTRHRWAGSRGQPFFYDNIKEADFADKVERAIDRVVRIAEGR